jgi:N-acetylglucosaminyldiphosphoundecaprenol N-acetyl-beta-D-mannosaminyltransferase
MEQRSIFGSPVTLGSYRSFVDNIIMLAGRKLPSYVCFANVHMIMEAKSDASFRKVLDDAAMVAPDGRPLSVFLKTFHRIKQDRVCGMDIMPDLLCKAEATGRSVYFYGGEQAVLEMIASKASHDFPDLRIAGYYSPPFRQLTNAEKGQDIQRIRNSGADLVFVSLGCPKQEKWMFDNSDKLNACLLGLGQAFTVYAGIEKRLPRWMRALSLEWVYRLIQEPRRLWKRYLTTNVGFLLLTMKYAVTRKA